MTWDADIVERAGKQSISGQFKISSVSEFQKFIEKMNYLAANAFMNKAITQIDDQSIKRETIKDEIIENKNERLNRGGRQKKSLPQYIPYAVTLTRQERNVFDLYHEGLSREKIAEKLKITSLAVKVHLSAVRRKIERASQ